MKYKIEYLNNSGINTRFVHIKKSYQNFINSHACIVQSRLDDLLRNPVCDLEVVHGTKFLAEVFITSKSKDVKEYIGCIVVTQKGKVLFLFNYESDSSHNKFNFEFFDLISNEISIILSDLQQEKTRPEGDIL